jgi:hypothetical protein
VKLLEALDTVCTEKRMLNMVIEGEPVFPKKLTVDDPDSKVLMVCGDNASGKSLLTNILYQHFNTNEVHMVSISLGERTKKGYMQDVRRFGRYGDEDEESSGVTTIRRIVKDFDRLIVAEEPFVLSLDEPDIGLAETFHSALGELIATRTNELVSNPHCVGVVLVSHSRKVFKAFIDYLETPCPIKLRVGCTETDFDHWFYTPTDRTLTELLNLNDFARQKRKRFKETQKALC